VPDVQVFTVGQGRSDLDTPRIDLFGLSRVVVRSARLVTSSDEYPQQRFPPGESDLYQASSSAL
jgi:hypothetical protein